jgi:hypothetical protein
MGAKKGAPPSSTSQQSTQSVAGGGGRVAEEDRDPVTSDDRGDDEVPASTTSSNARPSEERIEPVENNSVRANIESNNGSGHFVVERVLVATPPAFSKNDGKEEVLRLQNHMSRIKIRDTDVSLNNLCVCQRVHHGKGFFPCKDEV